MAREKSEGQKLRKMREAELKRRDRSTLRELATRIRSHRTTRRARLHEIRGLCRIGRQNLKQRIAKLRHDTLEQLRDTIARLREAERDQCGTTQKAERERLTKQIDDARRELELERMRFRERHGRKAGRVSAAERKLESDSEVEHELPPELVAVWRRVKKQIKARPRMSRAESFLHWAEENPDEVHSVLYAQADRDVAKLIAEHEKIERRLAKTRGYEDPEAEAGALAGVPF
jgi:hypothetical protein